MTEPLHENCASRTSTPEPEVIHFGCWIGPGHGFQDQRGRSLHPRRDECGPWGYGIDSLHDHGGHVPQGTRYLAHKDGWTVLDVTDRTIDKRPGSHTAFLAPMHLSEQGIVRAVAATFPQIAVRIGLIAPARATCASGDSGAPS